jgi:DNA segregation ATPase FtsK/SpoIIIE-like protein
MAEKIFIDYPPRIEPQLPSGIYEIPKPPDTKRDFNKILQQALLPMTMIVGYILVSMLNKGSNNLAMMIPMLLSVIATISLAIYTNSRDQKQRDDAAAAYVRRLGELRRKMESEHEEQRIYYYTNYPNPDKTLGIAADLNREADQREEEIRSGTRLWERRPKDHDFMYLRLGISTRQSTVMYRVSEDADVANSLMREATRLAEDSRLLYNVPVTVPVFFQADETEKKKVEKKQQDQNEKEEETQEAKGITIRHSIGITGKSDEKVHAYLRTMLIDYAAFQSPQDTMLYVAGTSETRQHWRWAYALPHCKAADKTETLYFEDDEKPLENEADGMRQFWKNLRTILERRRMRLQDKESGADVKIPFLLVVVDVSTPAPAWSCLHDLEGEAAISTILLDGQMLGAGIIFLVPDRSKVPSRCSAIIEVDDEAQDEESAVFRYAETGFNTVRYLGKTKLVASQKDARDFSRNLEVVDVRRAYGSSLAATVTLSEMLNINTLEQYQQMTLERWRSSMDPKQADWLFSPIGLLSGNEPRVLTFSAKADGVHGIVAGSTGSGKSELLMTMILGLALNFSPDVLNFVLIDYKGGSAFEPFKKLPHKVDIVTNLDQSATARVFTSIIAELDRRQRLNTYTNSKDIVHYRRKGLNLEPERPPYPHLFIIIDEFAEMISGNAEYKAQLESITRLGRALGVTLILAAQRPVGVTDQMRANIKFRICLRVETPDDSREVLRRSDAAFLPPGIPGRGYLQIGNENIELIQTAYSGIDYKGPQEETAVPNVIWLDRAKKSSGQKSTEPPKLYDVIVDMMDNLSKQESKPQWRPWPAFLPRQVGTDMLSLQTPLDTAYIKDADLDLLRGADSEKISGMALNEKATTFWEPGFKWEGAKWGTDAMRPLVGLIDNPYQASEKPLQINFPNGHAVVFGSSGRGKTTFLQTVITSLALTHSPDELQIYILDFGGRAMSVMSDLPHVGAVITAEEEERVTRVLRRVSDIIDQRQVLFSEAKANSLDSYNLSHPEKPLPAILVVMDNFAEFKEYYEGLLPPLISLVRESRAYGVYFLISADIPGSLSGKLFNLITERFTLKLSDPTAYSEIVGRGVPADLSPVPGRGYVRIGNTPLEFQTALSFTPDDNDPGGLGKLSKFCARAKQLWGDNWKGERPSKIETLPLRYSLENLLKQTKLPEIRRINSVLGIDDRTLEPTLVDLERQGPHMVVIGQPFSGKTTGLRTMILSTAASYSPDEVMMVLVDYSRKLWKASETSLKDLPHVVETIDNIEQLDEFLENFKVECADFDVHPKRRKIIFFIDNYDSFTDDSRKKAGFFENLSVLVRNYQTAGVFMVVAGSLGIMSASDDLRKVFVAPSFGLALRSADAVGRLNGKFPRSLSDVELPMGRAFLVRSGITSMLQIATPYANDEDIDGSLDLWVKRIKETYPQKNVQWLRSSGAGGDSKAKKKDKAEAKPADAAPKADAELAKYDIPSLRKKMIEFGMSESTVKLYSDRDIVENARALGLLDDGKKGG